MKYEYNKLLEKNLQKTPDTASDLVNVAAGYISSTNVQDAIDELNDEKVQITPAQTINVSTATELTAALAGLAAAPSLGGNVIIQVTANITGNFTIPTLLYNGFEVTIQGALTEVLSDVATGGADQVNGVSKGYYQKAGAAYVANAYRNMLMMNPSGHFVAIDSNDADQIFYSALGGATPSFLAFSNGETCKVYDWTYSITGNTATTPCIIVSEYAKIKFNNIKIDNTGNSEAALRLNQFSKVISRACKFESDANVFGAVNAYPQSSINSLSTVYMSANNCLKVELGATYSSRDVSGVEHYGGDVFFLKTTPSGYKAGLFLSVGAIISTFYPCINSQDSKPAGSKAVWVIDNATALLVTGFADSFETGVIAQYSGHVRNATMLYTNYTTLYTPAAATDPSYIL